MEELMQKILIESMEDIAIILDAESIANIAYDLIDEYDFELNRTEEEIDELVDNNDILQITKLVCPDCGEETYYVERVFDKEGFTLEDEVPTVLIDEDLVDCVDLHCFSGNVGIVSLSEECDCESCNCCEEIESLEDDDFEEETIGQALCEELFDRLEEIDEDDSESIYDTIVEYLDMAYDCGKNDMANIVHEKLDEI